MTKSKISVNIFAMIFSLLLISVLTNGFLIFQGMQYAVKVCLETMIPSLYAMMILSELFISCGFHTLLGKVLKFPARYIFKSSGQILTIFLFSQIAGYPIGTKMIVNMNENGSLTKKQASILSGVCFGSGPAFIVSLFENKKEDAAAVFLAGLLSNLIIFTIISRAMHIQPESNVQNIHKPLHISSMITDAAVKSGKALFKICAMIIMFGGILELKELPFLKFITKYKYSDIIFSTLEISRITSIFPYSRELLPFIGAVLSFGGICVLMQISAVSKDKINISYIFFIRIIAAIITWLLLYLREMFIPIQTEFQTETASVIYNESNNLNIETFSPIPSILLLIMTFMLLISADRKTKNCRK